MTVKVLVTAIGQQIVADTKQIENKETNQIVGYWLSRPRTVQYNRDEDGNLGVNFGQYCLVSDEVEFSLRGDHVVAILDPRQDVVDAWKQLVGYADASEAAEGEDASADAPAAEADADAAEPVAETEVVEEPATV